MMLVIYLFLITASVWDIKKLKIQNTLLTGFFVYVFSIHFSSNFDLFPEYFIGSFIIFLVFFLVLHFSKGIGAGDVKLVTLIALCFGFFKTIFFMLISCIVGFLVFLTISIVKIKTERLPFAPLAASGVLLGELAFRII